jgi:hypothetical protein
VPDFLEQKQSELAGRMDELRPLVDEYARLEAAAAALDSVNVSAVAVSPSKRGPGRPRNVATADTASAKPAKGTPGKAKPAKGKAAGKHAGRRKGSGARAAEALALVQQQPGITIPELAVKMGIKQNYLYRVLPSLEQEGKAVKKGRGWTAKEPATA